MNTQQVNQKTYQKTMYVYFYFCFSFIVFYFCFVAYPIFYFFSCFYFPFTGKTTLYSSDGKDDLIVDESDGNGKVVIHHYIYDEKTNPSFTSNFPSSVCCPPPANSPPASPSVVGLQMENIQKK